MFLEHLENYSKNLYSLEEIDIVEYIAFLSLGGLAPSTIRGNISGVRHHLKIRLLKHFEKSFIIALTLKGVAQDNPTTPDIRLPVSINMLIRMCAALRHVLDSPYMVLLYQTMFTVAFYGLFRPGELTLTEHAIQIENVSLQPCFAAIYLKSSKCHNQVMPPQLVRIGAQPVPVCPVFYLRTYIAVRPPVKGALFISSVGKPVTYAEFSSTLAKACKFLDLPAGQIKPHSFRIGGATHLHLQGASAEVIQKAGRWSSACFAKYICV